MMFLLLTTSAMITLMILLPKNYIYFSRYYGVVCTVVVFVLCWDVGIGTKMRLATPTKLSSRTIGQML